MTTTDIVTDPAEDVLLQQLEVIRGELVEQQRQVDETRRQWQQAVDTEGELMERAGELHRISDTLIYSQRQENQGAIFVGDIGWRMQYPKAAAAYDQSKTADDAVKAATVRTTALRRQLSHLEMTVHGHLLGALSGKEAELDAYRQSKQRAIDQAHSWPERVESFRKSLWGKA